MSVLPSLNLLSIDTGPSLQLLSASNNKSQSRHAHAKAVKCKDNDELDSLFNNECAEFVELRLFYDRNAYLQHTPRAVRNKTLGPLVFVFERFANWVDPRRQVLGSMTFSKIEKANSTMNVYESFVMLQRFGLFDDESYSISKPEVMVIFAMTVCSESQRDAKYVSSLQTEIMKEFEKHKSRHSRDLTEQHFPFFLCRIAIIMMSQSAAFSSLSNVEKVERFIEHFRFNDMKYVKRVLLESNSDNLRRNRDTHNRNKYLLKKTGLTNCGALGLEKITQNIESILCDVDIATAVKPLVNLQLATPKRDWIALHHHHLNMSKIYCQQHGDDEALHKVLKQYAYKMKLINKHCYKSIAFNVNEGRLAKYLRVKYENKVLSPGMTACIFISFHPRHIQQMMHVQGGKKLRSFLVVEITEKHHYQQAGVAHHHQKNMEPVTKTLSAKQIKIPITTCFESVEQSQQHDVYLNEQLCTPRDYPI